MQYSGTLRKMRVSTDADHVAHYELPVGDDSVAMNPLIGKSVSVAYTGNIFCTHCQRKTKKSFNQGYCYPCVISLAQCDTCIIKPEKCHYHEGTCREPEWGEENCFSDHFVYLANTGNLKVGITRGSQVPTRWIDQGAVTAIPMLRVSSRYLSRLVEVACKSHVADRTNWRAMLKGDVPELDLAQERQRILELIEDDLAQLRAQHGEDSIRIVDEATLGLGYPVQVWPAKVKTHNLDKTPEVEGLLEGIKGQYLMLDTGVINIRKFTGYEVRFRVLD